MFEKSLLEFSGGSRQASSLALATLIQVGLVVGIVLVPMMFIDVLPGKALASAIFLPAPPPAPPAPPAKTPVARNAVLRQFDPEGKLRAPRVIPKDILVIKDEELPPSSGPACPTCVVGGVPCGGPNQLPCGTGPGVPYSFGPPSATPPPPVVKPVGKPAVPVRIKVGGNVQAGKLVFQPKPVYPPFARQARVQGMVRLTAIIGKDGAIHSLRVISGHPLLVQAALEAVGKWRYRPTELNGEPVEVVTQIDVNFTLTQ